MNDIRALLRTAARRLDLNSFIGKLHMAAIVFAGVALCLMLADRIVAEKFVPWRWVGPALAALAFAGAALLWARRRPTEHHVALVVDERLDLREKLSTALNVQGRDDAFAQAAIEDAVTAARDGRTRELVRRRFAITPPQAWWISPLIIFLAIMVSLLNPLNLFAHNPQNDPAVKQAKLDAQQAVDQVVSAIKEKPELSKELAKLLGDASKDGSDPKAEFKPEDAKRIALTKLTEMSKKLDDLLNGEKGKTAEAIEKSMNQLKSPDDGPAKELAEAMAKGDFAQAQKALQELMEKAQNGQMKEEDKKKAAEQLQNIADQLNKLAQQQQQLENALKQAGMDPKLAQNAQALQQAVQQNQNLNQQQKQQLQQMAQAQQAAAQACKGMGQACQQMAQGLKAGQAGQMAQMGQAGKEMAQQLGQMEQLQQLLQEAQAAANQCQGQCNGLGQGLNMDKAMQQWCQKNGNNMGQRGHASGGKATYAPTPTNTKKEKANVNTVDGDIIAKQLFEGEQIRGDSKVQLVKVVEEARKGFDEGMTEDQMHVKYRDAQMHYFGELEKITKAIAAEDAAKAGTANKPAEKPADKAPPAETKPGG